MNAQKFYDDMTHGVTLITSLTKRAVSGNMGKGRVIPLMEKINEYRTLINVGSGLVDPEYGDGNKKVLLRRLDNMEARLKESSLARGTMGGAR